MFLTFVLAVLAAFGLLSILRWLLRALSIRLREEDICHVIYLHGDAPETEQTVKSCLRLREEGMKGRLIFVDEGLTPEAQTAVELLLRERQNTALCGTSQLDVMIKWERDTLGTGADQRQHRRGCL